MKNTKIKTGDMVRVNNNHKYFHGLLGVVLGTNNNKEALVRIFDENGGDIGCITYPISDYIKLKQKNIPKYFLKNLLVDEAIEQIKEQIENGDVTAIDELLRFVPIKNLIQFIPEENWMVYSNLAKIK